MDCSRGAGAPLVVWIWEDSPRAEYILAHLQLLDKFVRKSIVWLFPAVPPHLVQTVAILAPLSAVDLTESLIPAILAILLAAPWTAAIDTLRHDDSSFLANYTSLALLDYCAGGTQI
jgi:hypothetical protein